MRSDSYRLQRRRWIAFKLRWADLRSDHLVNLDGLDDASVPSPAEALTGSP